MTAVLVFGVPMPLALGVHLPLIWERAMDHVRAGQAVRVPVLTAGPDLLSPSLLLRYERLWVAARLGAGDGPCATGRRAGLRAGQAVRVPALTAGPDLFGAMLECCM